MPNKPQNKLELFFAKPTSLLILAVFALLILGLRYITLNLESPLLLTIGRFHPIILHFPLVLIMILLVVELLSLFKLITFEKSVVFYLLLLAILFTLISIFSGYFLFASGEYAGFLMDQHFNGAVITGCLGVLTLAFFLYYWTNERLYTVYFFALVSTNIAALYTGHQGGNLTHGQNYLTEYLPMLKKEILTDSKSDSSIYLYEDIIQPVLEAKCAGCHSTLRAKGDFSVSSFKDLLKKSESGKVPLKHYLPQESELFLRIMMPDSLSDHMPPAGKTSLDEKEIVLLKYWIEKGGNLKQSVLDSTSSDSTNTQITLLLNQLEPALKKYRFNVAKTALNDQKLEEELETLAIDMEVVIKRDDKAEGNMYTLSSTFPPAPFGSEKLAQLKPYLGVFTKVSLVSSQLDDADLYVIGQMKNLEELYLQKTKLKGSGLIHLSQLKSLKILNVSFTNVDDKALLDLIEFPALKQLYTYSTKTTKDVIIALQKYKPTLKIHAEEGPYF
jgi:uncharacterized membrane protein